MRENSTVFLFISNYVNASDLSNSGYLEYLSKKNKIIVFLPTLDHVGNYYSSSNIEYRLWHFNSQRFFGRMKLLRVGLIRKFDFLKSTQVHLRTSFNDSKRKILRMISLFLPFKLGDGPFSWVEVKFLKNSKEFKNLVQFFKPKIIAVSTPGFTDYDAEIITLAKKNNIPTVAINPSWDNLTTNAKHIRKTDYLVVWNDIIKNEAIKIHNYSEKKVFVAGVPRFDIYFKNLKPNVSREDFLKSKKLDPSLKTVLLTTTSNGVYPFHNQIIEDVLDLQAKNKIPKINLFVRIHPKDVFENYEKYKNLKNVIIELPGETREVVGGSRHKIELTLKDFFNLRNTLAYSDININYCSTMTLESLIFDLPVINLAYPKNLNYIHYLYEHYVPITKSGAVLIAESKSDLEKTLKRYLNDPNFNKKERNILKSHYIKYEDGKSYIRNVDFINSIIENI